MVKFICIKDVDNYQEFDIILKKGKIYYIAEESSSINQKNICYSYTNLYNENRELLIRKCKPNVYSFFKDFYKFRKEKIDKILEDI